MKNTLPFGRKSIVLGGDFRQVAPIIKHATKAQIVENSIKSGQIWQFFKILKLKKNMRADPKEIEFDEWLLKLGDGKLPIHSGDDIIQIPNECVVKTDLIAELYGNSFDLKKY
jgi:hypothetical protein